MPGRKPERTITDPDEIEYVLNKAQILRLAMCVDNKPYVVPMNFAHQEGTLYLHSATEGMKAEMLRANPNVCFEMDVDVAVVQAEKPCAWTARFKSIIGFGTATFVADKDEKTQALTRILAHYSDKKYTEFPEAVLDKTAVIRIDIESMTGKKHGWDD